MIVFLDTNVVIYAVEGDPIFGPKVVLRLAAALAAALAAGDSFMVSDLTRMEALVGPLKTNNTTVEASFRSFFTRPEVRVVAITPAVCDRAARTRATYKFKPNGFSPTCRGRRTRREPLPDRRCQVEIIYCRDG